MQVGPEAFLGFMRMMSVIVTMAVMVIIGIGLEEKCAINNRHEIPDTQQRADHQHEYENHVAGLECPKAQIPFAP